MRRAPFFFARFPALAALVMPMALMAVAVLAEVMLRARWQDLGAAFPYELVRSARIYTPLCLASALVAFFAVLFVLGGSFRLALGATANVASGIVAGAAVALVWALLDFATAWKASGPMLLAGVCLGVVAGFSLFKQESSYGLGKIGLMFALALVAAGLVWVWVSVSLAAGVSLRLRG